jgi:amino acid transporter
MIVVVVGLNLLPVAVYGESEFYFASIKVITIVGLLILSIVLFFWGGPGNPLLGFYYWKDPGAFNTYILEGTSGYVVSFWSTLISALLPVSIGSLKPGQCLRILTLAFLSSPSPRRCSSSVVER